jgi:hypothetical protein
LKLVRWSDCGFDLVVVVRKKRRKGREGTI